MKAINLEELMLLTHPGELKAIRDAKGSVYVPGWKTPKPAAVVARWKLETICRLIEQKRLYFYPITEEHKALARSVDVIQAPAGGPPEPYIQVTTPNGIEILRGPIAEGTTIKASRHGVEIIAPASNPEIAAALDNLPDEWHVENYDKSKEWYLAVTERNPERYGKLSHIGFNRHCTEEKANCIGAFWLSDFGTKLSREDFERLVYNPWKASQQAAEMPAGPYTEAELNCRVCSGPCGRCDELNPTPLNPEQAEAIQTLNSLRQAFRKRNNPARPDVEVLGPNRDVPPPIKATLRSLLYPIAGLLLCLLAYLYWLTK